jgi:hypothetical protein
LYQKKREVQLEDLYKLNYRANNLDILLLAYAIKIPQYLSTLGKQNVQKKRQLLGQCFFVRYYVENGFV